MQKGTIKPDASSRMIRENYRTKALITIAEAADLSGTNGRTVQNWLTEGIVMRGNRAGPFRVDHKSLLDHLKHGAPKNKPPRSHHRKIPK